MISLPTFTIKKSPIHVGKYTMHGSYEFGDDKKIPCFFEFRPKFSKILPHAPCMTFSLPHPVSYPFLRDIEFTPEQLANNKNIIAAFTKKKKTHVAESLVNPKGGANSQASQRKYQQENTAKTYLT